MIKRINHLKEHEINLVLDSLFNSSNYYKDEINILNNHLKECNCITLKKSITDSIGYCENMQKQSDNLRSEISEELGISVQNFEVSQCINNKRKER